MVVHAFGDAHCVHTFRGIPGCVSHHMGQVTASRVAREGGVPGAAALRATLRAAQLGEGDAVIACFGELDVRSGELAMAQQHDAVERMAAAYLDALEDSVFATLSPDVACAVMLPPPPARATRCAAEPGLPMRGSDEDRVRCHRELVRALREAGRTRTHVLFDPALRVYADEDGLLLPALSNGSHYYGLRAPVRQELEWLEWVVRPVGAKSSGADE
jgi:hypothetical protein